MPKIALGIYVLAAISFLMLSGRAEGFGTPRSIAILFGILAFLHCMSAMVWAAIIKRNKSDEKVLWPVLTPSLGFLLILGSMFLGFFIDRIVVEQTLKRGDTIWVQIDNHLQENGTCPNNLRDVFGEDKMPTPLIRNSSFEYWVSTPGNHGCSITFDAPHWIQCTKSNLEEEWYCAD